MQLSNARRIIVEDFPKDQRETVAKLAEIINPHMEEVVQLSQGNIGIDNLNRTIIKIDILVDSLGKAKGITQINTGLTTYSGNKIIDVQSLAGGDNVLSAPYLDCTFQGNGLVRINKFIGLPVGKKLRVTFEFIA